MSYYKYSRTVLKYVREEKENLSLPRALNPPWKPSVSSAKQWREWSGPVAARVHKHLSSPCPELSFILTILPFPQDIALHTHGNILPTLTTFRPTMGAGG